MLPIGAVSRFSWAQAYPSRPVRIIVPFAAGGGTDITARVIAQWLSERLGQQFVIENRPGGGTNIGTEAAAKATADGYTLLMVGTSNTANPALYDKLNFDLLRDFAPVAAVVRAPHIVVVNPALPDVPTVAESVPGFESSIWFGLSAPRNTPVEIIDTLNREVNAGLADPRIKARYAELGSTVFPISPADFDRLIVAETEKWAKVVKFSGAKPE